jgi:hypothetical protein
MARVVSDPGSVRRAVRLAVGWALVAGIVVAGSPAFACSCVQMDLATRLPEVDGAFIGTFVERETVDERRVAITFQVERVIKGEFGPRAIVRSDADGASCGLEFYRPRAGLLLDRASDGVWESNLCQQVTPDQLLAFAPDASPPDHSVDPIDPGSVFPWWAFALVGVFVVGGVIFLAMRTRRGAAPPGESGVA